ncbi:GNAT family N-acetyltransferase [Sulfidibacter corallicola]|uniref:GNAT family N-acetyltransferase n=1 Tax=Sulfidibacter corallicola TaxID=2818388 RepID=A0A8A4TE24_SULCO|nr:GNAT family N-acetyltransferase [Sulfidibacter corallicola]QTD48349.1 GNAT family N-acetyltransferase [Sulfidibacter corallicola]
MTAAETWTTERLILRKPIRADETGVFAYARDPEVTRFMSWPRHTHLRDTREFLELSDSCWETWSGGPLLICDRATGAVLGSTGFFFVSKTRAETGYVLARKWWGRGYATEALKGTLALAPELGLLDVYAKCHPENPASIRVLQKCGFRDGGLTDEDEAFPNHEKGAVKALVFLKNL